ncbi:MAG: ABC transporter substrate-binding protein [Chloroflexota bacterium]
MSDRMSQLLADYRARTLTRRGLMVRAAALGVGAGALGSLLASESAAAARQDSPTPGGMLREGYDLDFSRMDPVATTWYDPAFYALFETVAIDSPDGELQPMLAESWDVAEDGMSVTFKIHQGAKFHSGRAVDAAAIKEVYDAIKDPANGSPLAVLFTPVVSIEAPDPTTLVLTMSNPYYEVMNVVKTGYWAIVNIATRSANKDVFGQSVVDGTGPFTFKEWVPGSHVEVQKWADYPGSIVPYYQNKGPAYLDGIKWTAILEGAQRAVQIENGEIDTLRNPLLQDVARLEGNPDLTVQSFSEPSGYIFGQNFDRTDLDFHEVKMRQAISHAIDRNAIVKALLFDLGSPLFGPITPADKYYDKNVEQFNQYDVEKARALVAELGWTPNGDGILEKNGTKMAFSLVVQDESFNRDLGSVIQAQLKEIGMDVTVETLDRGSYFGKLSEGPDSYLFYYLWAVPIDVVILFVGTATKGAPNWGNASVPAVDDAIKAWQTAGNEEQLVAAGNAFQMAIAENLPTIPLAVRNTVWVNRPNVRGWMPQAFDIYPHYNDVWLAE